MKKRIKRILSLKNPFNFLKDFCIVFKQKDILAMVQQIQLLQITPPELAALIAVEVGNALRPLLATLQTPPKDSLLTRAERGRPCGV